MGLASSEFGSAYSGAMRGRRVALVARRAASIALVSVAAVLLIVAMLLPPPGDGNLPLLSLLVAFHAMFLVVVACVAFVTALVAIVLRWRWAMIIAAVVILAVSVAVAVPAVVRSPGGDPARVAASGKGTLRVLEWNTAQQDVDVTTIQTLITQTDPNVVVLPEYSTQIAKTSLATIAKQRDMQILGWNSSSATLLVSRSLGEYRVDHTDTPPWAGFVAVPSDAEAPWLVITHLQRPSISSATLWREHLEWAASRCRGNAVAIGDFNATADEISPSRTLGECADCATRLGQDPQGTWPAALPGSLGATIDHVFAGASWRPATFSVLNGLDRAGSDHRPTFAVLVAAP